MEKHVLGLELPTDPRWTGNALNNIHDVLVDHAYCEQKAASSCISLIIQYPDNDRLVKALMPVVTEEWIHFERVVAELHKRGMTLGHARKDEYVEQLQNLMLKGGSRQQQLTEKLLFNALIEARSCERFRLLAGALDAQGEPDLARFYRDLLAAEARHFATFVELSIEVGTDAVRVRARLGDLAAAEGNLTARLNGTPTIHG